MKQKCFTLNILLHVNRESYIAVQIFICFFALLSSIGIIPVTDSNGQMSFLKYNGQEVWSKLDADTLRKVVYATEGGKYLSVLPGTTLDLGQIYDELIASAQKRELESTTMIRYDERFQIFLALGLILIASLKFPLL